MPNEPQSAGGFEKKVLDRDIPVSQVLERDLDLAEKAKGADPRARGRGRTREFIAWGPLGMVRTWAAPRTLERD